MTLRVEYALNPLAVGVGVPRFSWEVPLTGRDRRQTAYQVLVATDKDRLVPEQANLWDSGRVDSSQSVHVDYAGRPLASNIDCWWRVRVWNESGAAQDWSAPAYFGTALLEEGDWLAAWIGLGPQAEPIFDPYSVDQDDGSDGLSLAPEDMQKLPRQLRTLEPELRSPMLRTVFDLDKPVRRARAFVCGVGLFELRLNGAKVGTDVLSTPRTEFRKRVYYHTYDITDLLSVGPNALGLLLGGGWYNGQKKYWHWQMPWYGSPRARVQLEIEYDDGECVRVVSDESWRGDYGPILRSCIYDGEDYDARLEQPDWDTPGFDDAHWRGVNRVEAPGGRMVAMDHPPNAVMQTVKPVALHEPSAGVFVFDMGTVMTGWARLIIPQGRAGETVTLRYAELQYEEGHIDPRTAGGARQADCYTMKGAATETYAPRFTYHGFRYVEVTGFPGTPTLETLEGCFVHQGVAGAGEFSCGHELINKIHRCTLQSQRCNLQMGVPTDDTQRPERLGWCGDAWSYAEESFYNLDVASFWSKWIADFYDQQDEELGAVGYITPLPGWGEDLVWSAAFVLIPWWHYQYYGDRRILERSYPYLQKYLAYLERVGEKSVPSLPADQIEKVLLPCVRGADRYPAPERRGHLQRSRFGDHLATHEGGSGMGKDQPRSMATAFFHHDALIMARIAETLGHDEDAQRYRQLADDIQGAFNDCFFDVHAGFYDVGCQSAQALALAFGLVPEAHRERVQGYLNSAVNFRQRRITSGYAGTKWVIRAIADSGRDDIIWNRAISTDYPSWGHMLADDKTTITENWHGGASQCHTTLGAAIDEWFYRGLLGIRPDPDAPGFERIVYAPFMPQDLPFAKGAIQTPRGRIASSWRREGESVSLGVTVPAGSSATVILRGVDAAGLTEGGQPLDSAAGIHEVASSPTGTRIGIGSGIYHFCWHSRKGSG